MVQVMTGSITLLLLWSVIITGVTMMITTTLGIEGSWTKVAIAALVSVVLMVSVRALIASKDQN